MRLGMKTRTVFLLALGLAAAPSAVAKSHQIIDLGSLRVEGAARGPEINVIEMGMDEETTGRILLSEIRKMERPMLQTHLPRSTPSTGEVH